MAVNLAGSGQQLDGSLPTVYEGFKLLYDATGVMRSTATMMKLKPHSGTGVNVNNYGRLVAYTIGDGVDITQAQDLSDATTTFTPGEVAVQAIVAGSTQRRIADPDVFGKVGRMAAAAYDLKEDQDGASQLVNFTNALGSAGTVFSPGHALAAQTRALYGNNRSNPEPFPGPWYLTHHPAALLAIAGRCIPLSNVPTGTNVYGANTGAHAGITTTNGGPSSMGESILREGIGALGHFAGATVKATPNLIPDSSDDASGAYYSKEGLIYVNEVEARMNADSSDKSMRGAIEFNFWGSYTWGIYRSGASGVELLFDCSNPTS